jgi:hypothetical protein
LLTLAKHPRFPALVHLTKFLVILGGLVCSTNAQSRSQAPSPNGKRVAFSAQNNNAGSAAGRSGAAHVIASITGEKYADLTTAQERPTNGSAAGVGEVVLAGKSLSGLKQAIQATLARFRTQKTSVPANFSLALTFNISAKGEAVNLNLLQSSGLKAIDEAPAEILRRAGDLGVLGQLNVLGSIRAALELSPASAHFLIAWPLAVSNNRPRV